MEFSSPEKNIAALGVSEGMHVADFGSGAGFYARVIAKKVGDSGRVYAIDIQGGLLGRLSDALRDDGIANVEIVRGDLETPGGSQLRDGLADAVIASNILFQIKDKETFAREAARVLKPGGRALVVDWTDAFSGIGPDPQLVVAKAEARRVFESAGLSFEREITAGAHHYGLVLRKGGGAAERRV